MEIEFTYIIFFNHSAWYTRIKVVRFVQQKQKTEATEMSLVDLSSFGDDD
jgi:hypothetical protein